MTVTRPMKCHCGQHRLTEATRWVAYPDTVHLQSKCGPFRELSIRVRAPGLAPILTVYWPRKAEGAEAQA